MCVCVCVCDGRNVDVCVCVLCFGTKVSFRVWSELVVM